MSFIQQAVLVDPNDEFKPYLPTLKIALYDKGEFVRNLEGPQGPVGPQGEVGPVGPEGPAGSDGGSATVVQELAAVATASLIDLVPGDIYEIIVDGIVSTSADTNITLKTVGGSDLGHSHIVKEYADAATAYRQISGIHDAGLGLAQTGWNTDSEMLIRVLLSLREDRRVRAIADYTLRPTGATDQIMRGSVAAYLSDIQSLDELTLHFGAGTFTGQIYVRTQR